MTFFNDFTNRPESLATSAAINIGRITPNPNTLYIHDARLNGHKDFKLEPCKKRYKEWTKSGQFVLWRPLLPRPYNGNMVDLIKPFLVFLALCLIAATTIASGCPSQQCGNNICPAGVCCFNCFVSPCLFNGGDEACSSLGLDCQDNYCGGCNYDCI